MYANKITFNKDLFSNTALSNQNFLHLVDTITIDNNNPDFTGPRQINNNRIGGTLDPVVLKSHGDTVSQIVKLLDNGRKTNQFSQFFGRQAQGSERVHAANISQSQFNRQHGGAYIRIVFERPVFVIHRYERPGHANGPWEIQPFNANYENERPYFETTNAQGDTIRTHYGRLPHQYNNAVIHSINIPLGNVSNRFAQHTWNIQVGTHTMSNSNRPSTMTYTYTTFGNYNDLARYVERLTNNKLA
jgi:hypothetical protein